jgi:uncharacterized protein YdhG (YjbR/CyaY superfamily)
MAVETIDEYLDSLPEDRREAIEAVRSAVAAGIPEGYAEELRWGMISWEIPLETYPETYNGQPLAYVSLASQKNHMALYLMGIYSDEGNRAWFENALKERGIKLDIGKSCVRFKRLEDLPLDLVTEAAGRYSVNDYIKTYEKSRGLA